MISNKRQHFLDAAGSIRTGAVQAQARDLFRFQAFRSADSSSSSRTNTNFSQDKHQQQQQQRVQVTTTTEAPSPSSSFSFPSFPQVLGRIQQKKRSLFEILKTTGSEELFEEDISHVGESYLDYQLDDPEEGPGLEDEDPLLVHPIFPVADTFKHDHHHHHQSLSPLKLQTQNPSLAAFEPIKVIEDASGFTLRDAANSTCRNHFQPRQFWLKELLLPEDALEPVNSMSNANTSFSAPFPTDMISSSNYLRFQQQQQQQQQNNFGYLQQQEASQYNVEGNFDLRLRSHMEFCTKNVFIKNVSVLNSVALSSSLNAPSPTSVMSGAAAQAATKPKDKWTSKYEQLIEYRRRTGHCCVPYNFTENLALARWVKRQRCQYHSMLDNKKSTMTQERILLLEEIGFVWKSQRACWFERLDELKFFKKMHGHTNVPCIYDENQQLATWVKCQRRQHKLYAGGHPCNISEERVSVLNKIGFEWEILRKN